MTQDRPIHIGPRVITIQPIADNSTHKPTAPARSPLPVGPQVTPTMPAVPRVETACPSLIPPVVPVLSAPARPTASGTEVPVLSPLFILGFMTPQFPRTPRPAPVQDAEASN